MMTEPRIEAEISSQPYPLLFVTISGAHLYGFPSPDSDYDLRGAHILPVKEVVGLEIGQETIEAAVVRDGLEIDLVTHDLKKFFSLLLRKNGYVLEQLYSSLVLRTSPEHEELNAIARNCLTRHHSHHYLGFAETQWKLFNKEHPRRVKPLLYVYRVLLTGIHLMRSGVVEASLFNLNQEFRLSYLDDLIAYKLNAAEQAGLDVVKNLGPEFHEREYQRLRHELEDAYRSSALPESATGKAALNDLLVRLRMKTVIGS
jgi:predicted nucleotidyltransferase